MKKWKMMIKNSLFLPARSVVGKCHNKTSDICFKLQENIDFLQYFIKMNNIIGTSHFGKLRESGGRKAMGPGYAAGKAGIARLQQISRYEVKAYSFTE